MSVPVHFGTPIGTALVPGRFDADDDTWIHHIADAADDVVELEDGTEVPVTQIVLTETTDKRLPKRACPDGWRWHRLWEPPGASNISILLRKDRWATHPTGPYEHLLSDDKVWTKKGNPRPFHYALVVPAVDLLDQGRSMMLAGGHNPLRNTPRRVAAAREALANTKTMWAQGRTALGDEAVRLAAFDWNLSVTSKNGRAEWEAAFPGFTPSWADGDFPNWKRLIDFQAGGTGLVRLETEWHRRKNTDAFDHPWSVTAWGYATQLNVPTPPVPLEPACPAVLMLAGQAFPCTVEVGDDFKHPGLAHANAEADALWASNPARLQARG